MDTSKVESASKIANSIWDQFTHAPAHLLLLLVMLTIGILIKKSPTPNWLIPWILIILGAFGYPLLASAKNIDPSYPNPDFVLRLYGGMLGIASIVVHMQLRRFEWWCKIEYAIVNAGREEEDKVKPFKPPENPEDPQNPGQ